MEEGSKGGFNMQIGERIRCLRISKGLTQYDLAQAIHISSSFMNRIEKGPLPFRLNMFVVLPMP